MEILKPLILKKLSSHSFVWFTLGVCSLVVVSFWWYTSTRPLFDLFSFRQCQTAMSALWFDLENPVRGLFFYETPEFGVPWMVPFEFPLYQGVAAGISHHTGLPLTAVGRMLSGFFLLASLYPIFVLFRQLGLGFAAFGFSVVFLLCSPLYLYWSRSFMIESTAVFFGFGFLALACLACRGSNFFFWVGAVLCGVLCALVKATTFPSFGVAAVLAAFAILAGCGNRLTRQQKCFRFLGVVLAVGVCIGAALLWTNHADALKAMNPLSAHLVSESLGAWNYGTLAQRFSKEFWVYLIWGRAVPEAIGSPFFLAVPLAALVFSDKRERFVLLGLLGLFLLPMLLFTNLHLVHNYYQYANSFWLVLALGVSFGLLCKKLPKWVLVALGVCVVAFQVNEFSQRYFTPTTWKWNVVMDLGKKVKKETPKNSAILVAGDDWSPEVAFYSERKAIYIPNWVDGFFEVDDAALVDALEYPEKLLGGLPLSAVVFRAREMDWSALPKDRRDALGRLLLKLGPPIEEAEFGDYTLKIYLKKDKPL